MDPKKRASNNRCIAESNGKTEVAKRTTAAFKKSCPPDADVLVGRGKRVQRHLGNICFLKKIDKLLELYHMCQRGTKQHVVTLVLDWMDNQNGHFVKPDANGNWVKVSKKEAREKVSLAFRHRRIYKSSPKRDEAETHPHQRSKSSESQPPRLSCVWHEENSTKGLASMETRAMTDNPRGNEEKISTQPRAQSCNPHLKRRTQTKDMLHSHSRKVQNTSGTPHAQYTTAFNVVSGDEMEPLGLALASPPSATHAAVACRNLDLLDLARQDLSDHRARLTAAFEEPTRGHPLLGQGNSEESLGDRLDNHSRSQSELRASLEQARAPPAFAGAGSDHHDRLAFLGLSRNNIEPFGARSRDVLAGVAGNHLDFLLDRSHHNTFVDPSYAARSPAVFTGTQRDQLNLDLLRMTNRYSDALIRQSSAALIAVAAAADTYSHTLFETDDFAYSFDHSPNTH